MRKERIKVFAVSMGYWGSGSDIAAAKANLVMSGGKVKDCHLWIAAASAGITEDGAIITPSDSSIIATRIA